MKIEIKIEADKEVLETIQKQFGTVAAGLSTVVKFFEQFEFSLKNKAESKVMEPSSENIAVLKEESISAQETSTDDPGDMKLVSEPAPETAPSVENASSASNAPSLDTDVDDISPAKPEIALEKKSGVAKPVTRKKVSRKTKKTPNAGPVKKSKTRVTSQETVLSHIKKSKSGLDSTLLQAKTGFSAKKVADAVYQLKKKGLIEKKEKGTFVAL